MSERPLRVVVLLGAGGTLLQAFAPGTQQPGSHSEGRGRILLWVLQEQGTRHGEILFRTFPITMAYSPGVREN